jgi:hypothetical protein
MHVIWILAYIIPVLCSSLLKDPKEKQFNNLKHFKLFDAYFLKTFFLSIEKHKKYICLCSSSRAKKKKVLILTSQ